uniref:Uncharacterized protein n=1 Tax=Lactuca sativa TaxID=4236 RepID=A0A9R1X113_LACSA|nr:hypothetical protein LSAT_V11C800433450 [Lactuca sativa]
MNPLHGEWYESSHQLKQRLTNYVIHTRFSIIFSECDTVKLVSIRGLRNDTVYCPFRVNFKIINLMHPNWLARHFAKDLMRKPNLKCKETQSLIRNKFHCEVYWSKAY